MLNTWSNTSSAGMEAAATAKAMQLCITPCMIQGDPGLGHVKGCCSSLLELLHIQEDCFVLRTSEHSLTNVAAPETVS